jgi:hypothetical protein
MNLVSEREGVESKDGGFFVQAEYTARGGFYVGQRISLSGTILPLCKEVYLKTSTDRRVNSLYFTLVQ